MLLGLPLWLHIALAQALHLDLPDRLLLHFAPYQPVSILLRVLAEMARHKLAHMPLLLAIAMPGGVTPRVTP